MAAFDRIRSGLPHMDEVLDDIRLGDNVVWQISDLEEIVPYYIPIPAHIELNELVTKARLDRARTGSV